MIPKNINRDHVLAAINETDRVGVPNTEMPTKYWLQHEGRQYPPKRVVALANRYANEEELNRSSFFGGSETNNFLHRLGFQVMEADFVSNTSREKILETLDECKAALCDDCLSQIAEVKPRQQVNQISRLLVAGSKINRFKDICSNCNGHKIVNQLLSDQKPSAASIKKPCLGEIDKPLDMAAELDDIRRKIIDMLYKLDSQSDYLGIAKRIGDLSMKNVIPRHIAATMHLLREFRNVAVYTQWEADRLEQNIIQNSWRLVQKWWNEKR